MIPEPKSYSFARIGITCLLFLAVVSVGIFNYLRYINSAPIYRSTKLNRPLNFPSVLVMSNYRDGDAVSVNCHRVIKNETAVDTKFQTQKPIKLQQNPVKDKDYKVDDFQGNVYVNSTDYLLNAYEELPKPLEAPFKSETPDLYLLCNVTINNPTRTSPSSLLGQVFVEHIATKPNVKQHTPAFPTSTGVFLLANWQYMNLYVTVSELCLFSDYPGQCSTVYEVTNSQSIASTFDQSLMQNGTRASSYFTVQLTNSPSLAQPGAFVIEQKSETRSYGYLEIVSSLLSISSACLTFYFWLMGTKRLRTLGFIQRMFLKDDTEKFLKQLQDQAQGDEVRELKNVLFSLYLEEARIGSLKHEFKQMP